MIRPRGGSRGALRGTGETMHRFISLFLVAMTGVSGAAAGEWPVPDAGPDAIEPGSVERIREYTTAPEFLSPAVAYVPAVAGVPSPAQVLGHVIGAPGVLSRTADVHGYFDRLAAASPRVATFEILRTEEARPVRVAVIGSAANLKRLASIQQAMWDLADPRRGDAAAVREMLRGLPVVYHLNGGLHSTEVGSPEMLMELGHRLATSEKESIRKIRDNVLVVINPVSEPDGRDKMVDWFERYLRGQVNHDDMPPRSPPYWGKYVFHDNNRDAIQATTAVTEAALDVFFRFHPVVMLDLHESVPFLYISTGTGPYNESIDPVTISEWQQMANYEIGQVTAAGMPGAWTWGFFDGWSPNYLIWIANTHNAIGRFYETFGNGSAETMERTLDPERDRYSDTPVTERTWYRPLPPSATVTWSLRDNTNYMETGVLAALEFAAAHRVELLTHYVEKGERAVRRGRDGSPHAWLVPLEQDDPWRTGLLLFTLSNQGVEIHRLSRPFTAGGRVFPAGTAVVRLDQPYGPLAQGLLSRQAFPADGPRPYDDVSWSLPLHYGVEAIAVDDPLILDAPMERLDGADIPYEGAVHGEGPLLVMPDRGQEGVFQAVEAFAGFDVRVSAASAPFTIPSPRGERTAHGRTIECPPGTLLIELGAKRDKGLEAVEAAAANLGLTFYTVRHRPDAGWQPLTPPRLGVYESWASTQDAGWVRYTLDRAHVKYEMLHDAELRAGGLASAFDVILVPDTRGKFSDIVSGIDPRHGDLAFSATPEYVSHGEPFSSPSITGGMGLTGLANLFEFAQEGGVLITLGNAGTLVVESGLIRELTPVTGKEFRSPGAEIRATFSRPDDPIARGYPRTVSVFRRDGPLWKIRERSADHVVLAYGDGPAEETGEEREDLVLSGMVEGEEIIAGKPAIVDMPVGAGRVVLFNFNPLHRYLNHSDFRLVYNAILYARSSGNGQPGGRPEASEIR